MKVVFNDTKNSLSITYSITNKELDEKIAQTAMKIAMQKKYFFSIGEDNYQNRFIRIFGINIKTNNIKEQIEKLI